MSWGLWECPTQTPFLFFKRLTSAGRHTGPHPTPPTPYHRSYGSVAPQDTAHNPVPNTCERMCAVSLSFHTQVQGQWHMHSELAPEVGTGRGRIHPGRD